MLKQRGAGGCSLAGTVRISYDRLYLDEVGGTDGTNNPASPAITNPGVGTAPFYQTSGVPCLAAFREASSVAGEYRSSLGQLYGGRSTVFAFAQGEESFIDTDGNGQYDFNEPFVDLSEAFHDLNEDNVFGNGTPGTDDSRNTATPTCYGPVSPLTTPPPALDKCFQEGGDEETFVDFGDNDSTNTLKDLDGLFNAGNGIYNGTLCPDAISLRTDTCDNGADPCDEATERYCTRDLVNIRRDIVILLSGSTIFASLRASTGEYISSVDLTGDPASGLFDAGVSVTANNGTTVYAAGTDFDIGFADLEVAPGIGETVSLRSGTGSVLLDISDEFSGRLPTGTTITVTAADCILQNSPSGSLADSSGLGGVTIGISLGAGPNPGSAPITTTVTTTKGLTSQFLFTCVTP